MHYYARRGNLDLARASITSFDPDYTRQASFPIQQTFTFF